MSPPQFVIPLVIVFVESLTGFTLNTCLLVTNFKDWRRGRCLQLCDLLHMALGLVNLLLQAAVSAHTTLCIVYLPILYIKEVYMMFCVVLPFLAYSSFWLNAWLCVYYVTTITSSQNSFFVWLKSRISTMMSKLVLVSAVGSFSVSLLSIWNVSDPRKTNGSMTSNSSGNILYLSFPYQMAAASLGCFLPFVLSILCIGHILTFLARHVWRVKHDGSGFSRSGLRAHVRAVRTMILLVLLFVSFYLSQVFSFLAMQSNFFFLGLFFILFFPSGEALIIIQANSKLRKAFVEMFSFGK
ncbi:taste receptor type 2 member 9-like [Spea bombifrons]|uniref:taste receptor type 2 member 9-like n=1 Tax=Spea bombifrons TaxID=233779 RepID=UPI00234A9D9B|nr:taste receptor type 2 member 9-like [Spea bombifrons]